jgi:ribosomal protein S18 acetylase RimI-like enzyme
MFHAPYSAQGQAIGQSLLDHAKQLAKEQNAHFLWLGVWEHNPGAIRFYERNGFQKFGEHPFILGKDVQNDFLMRLACRDRSRPVRTSRG